MSAELYNFIIYKTVNIIDNKIYVGQHRREKKYYLGSGVKFKVALKKYGKRSFKRLILEKLNQVTQSVADERERFWIKALGARNPNVGYNLAIGGLSRRGKIRVPGTYKHSPEVREKIKKQAAKRKGKPAWNRGRSDYLTTEMLEKMRKPKSEEHRAKMKGRVRSEETVKRMNESKIKNKDKHRYPKKPVIQKTKDGITIKEWPSVSEAAESLKLKISDISRCCKGIGKSCGSFRWDYQN